MLNKMSKIKRNLSQLREKKTRSKYKNINTQLIIRKERVHTYINDIDT